MTHGHTPFGTLRKRKPRLRPNISLSLTSVTVLGTHDLLPRGCVVIVSLWLIAKPFLWRKAAHTQLPLQHDQRSVCVMSVMRKEIPRTGAPSRERNAVSRGQGAGSLSWCLGLEAPATCGHLPPTASSLWKLLHIDLPVSPVSWLCPMYLSQEWHSREGQALRECLIPVPYSSIRPTTLNSSTYPALS